MKHTDAVRGRAAARPESPASILIIRLSSLGDIIHTLPAYQMLRESFPDAAIDWLAERNTAFLLSAVPSLRAVRVVDTRGVASAPTQVEKWRALGRLTRELREARYDIALDFQGLLKTAFLAYASRARETVGFGRALVWEKPAHWFYTRALGGVSQELHVTELNRRVAGLAGARGAQNGSCVPLAATPDQEQKIRAMLAAGQLSKFVVINPGGGWPTKMWQAERFGALAHRIRRELDLPVVVTTGPGEEDLYTRIARSSEGAVPRHFPVAFLDLIPLFRQARLVIGGDTGPVHLACALGCPAVVILGPTSPVRNGPWTGEDVAVCRTLPCSFCYGRKCPTANECMEIPVEEVFAGVVRRLQTSEGSRKAAL